MPVLPLPPLPFSSLRAFWLRALVLVLLLGLSNAHAGDFDLTAAGYLGDASDDEEIMTACIKANGDIVVAAVAGPNVPALADAVLLNGATGQTKGVVMVLSPDGKTVKTCARVANRVYDMALDAAENIYVAVGTQGLLALDPTATTVRWSVAAPVDILDANKVAFLHRVDANGTTVAILASATGVSEGDLDSKVGTGTVIVRTSDGVETARFQTLGGRNANDITIDPATGTLVLVGWRQANDWWISGSAGGPVQIPLIAGYTFSGAVKWIGYDWSTDPNNLSEYHNRNGLFVDGTKTAGAVSQNNMADARLYRVALGLDGTVVVTGHSAGGNHPYRWAATDLMDTTERAYPCITDDIGPTGFTVRAKMNENGRAYYVIVPNGATKPTPQQVKAGQDSTGTLVAANLRGAIDLVAGIAGMSAEVTGLAPATDYDVMVVAEDDSGNLTTVTKVDVTTAKVSWTSSYPQVERTSATEAVIKVSLIGGGNAYWVAVPDGEVAPTPVQIKAGQDATGASVPAERKGTVVFAARGSEHSAVLSLSSASAWDVYAIAEDVNGQFNAQSTDINGAVIPNAELAAVTVAPTLDRFATEDAFNSGFTTKARTNQQCTAYMVVVANNAAAPTAYQIRAGQDASGNPALRAGSVVGSGDLRCTFSGFSQNTDYDVYWTAEGFAAGQFTAPTKVDSKTANDTTPPVWDGTTPPAITSVTTDSLTFRVKLNERSTVHWVCLPMGATVPTSAQVKEGKDASGAQVDASLRGSFVAAASISASKTISNLAVATNYRIALVAENDSGLIMSSAVKVDAATLDAVSGVGWTTVPTVSDIGTTAATLRFKNAKGGTGYYLVRPAGSAEPTLTEVKASSSVPISWKLPAVLAVRGLIASTAYDIWVVATDPSGVNLGPTKVSFTTLATDTTAPVWTGAALYGFDYFCSYAGASSQHLGFAGRYDISKDYPVFVGGQGVVARLSAVTPNTMHAEGGAVAGGSDGRLFLVGQSAYGLPFWPNEVWTPKTGEIGYNPFGYNDSTGGAFMLVLHWHPTQKWFNQRDYTTRLAYGRSRTVAVRNVGGKDRIVFGGRVDLQDGPMYVVGDPLQSTPGYGQSDGFLVVMIPGQNNDVAASSGSSVSGKPTAMPIKTSDSTEATPYLRNAAPERLDNQSFSDGQTGSVFRYAWKTDTDTLTPASGSTTTGAWTYSGLSFYGGFISEVVNPNPVRTASASQMSAYSWGKDRSAGNMSFHFSNKVKAGEKLRDRAAIYVGAHALLGLPETDRLSFDSDSRLAFTFEKVWDATNPDNSTVAKKLRFLVRDGTTFYVSKTEQGWAASGVVQFGTNTLTFGSDSSDGEWAEWSPDENVTFNAATATWATRDFQNITAVGFYIEDQGWRMTESSTSNMRMNNGFDVILSKNAATNRSPEARFTLDKTHLRVGESVTADASASSDPDGTVAFITWEFGDRIESSGSTVSHAYKAAGRYPITCTVWDNGRVKTSLTKYVDVVRGNASDSEAAGMVACWSGEMATGGDEYFYGYGSHSTPPIETENVDLDGDGAADDNLIELSFYGIARPLSGSMQIGTRLFGGLRVETRNSGTASRLNGWPRSATTGMNGPDSSPWMLNGVLSHAVNVAYNSNGDAVRSFGLFAIDKVDFLGANKDPSVKVAFTSSSLLRLGPMHVWDTTCGSIRFAVRDGTQWYVSETSYTTTTQYRNNLNNAGYTGNPLIQMTDPNAQNWIAFDPATTWDPPNAGGAPHTFTDVTAFGYVIDGDTWGPGGNISPAGLELHATNDAASKPAPVAAFSATPNTGVIPVNVALDASATTAGLGVSYLWDFGDGVTEASATPATSHGYGSAGTYTVKLTVTDSIGRSSITTQTITATTSGGVAGAVIEIVSGATVAEGQKAPITLRRTGDSGGTVSVAIRSVNGTARDDNSGQTPAGQGPDYTAVDTRVTWASGELGEKVFEVETLSDGINEGDETLTVVISEPYGGASLGATTSATVTITNVTAVGPTITTHPSNTEVNEDGITTFSVVATGPQLSYQWKKDGVALVESARILQTQTNQLKLKNVLPGDAGAYTCVVSNLAGSVTSNAGILSVNNRPVITISSPSVPRVALPDHNDTLYVAATATDANGTPLTYVWSRVSGPGTHQPVFSAGNAAATGVTFPAAGTYVIRCTASDSVLSATADLTVEVDAGWVASGVGPETVTGSGSISNGAATVVSSWTKNPNGMNGWFIRTRKGGDFSVTVRMASKANEAQSWSSLGILATQHTAVQTAPYAFMGQYAGMGAVAIFRGSEAGTDTSNRVSDGPWFRLTRSGDVFTAFRSPDGVTWTQQMAGQVVAMQDPILVGLIVNSHNNGTSISASDLAKNMTVTFDNVSGLPDVDSAPDVDVGSGGLAAMGIAKALSGSVTDDGNPGSPGVTAAWSKVSGPGEVTFANTAAASTTVTFNAPGTYVLRLTGDDSVSRVWKDVTVVVEPDFASWIAQHPDVGVRNSAGDDPDRDGVPNLLEYALGGDPARSGDTVGAGALMSSEKSGNFLRLRFKRARLALTYRIEVSSDCLNWTTIVTNPGEVGQDVTYTDDVDLTTVPRRFLRLKVDQ